MSGSHTYSSLRKLLSRSIVILALALAASSVATAPATAHARHKYWKEQRHIKHRARSAVGSPYSSDGIHPSGFDCSGFTHWAYYEHGENLPHSALDQFRLAGHHGYERVWKRKKLHMGDLVFFKTTSARVGHVDVYVGHGKFIASNSSTGVKKESVYDPYYWGRRFVGATRPPVTRPR